jgi:hypothetical protein
VALLDGRHVFNDDHVRHAPLLAPLALDGDLLQLPDVRVQEVTGIKLDA